MQRFTGAQISRNVSNLSSSTGVRSHGGGILSVGGKKIEAKQYIGKSVLHVTKDLKAKGLDATERRRIVSVLTGDTISGQRGQAPGGKEVNLADISAKRKDDLIHKAAMASKHNAGSSKMQNFVVKKMLQDAEFGGAKLSAEQIKALTERVKKEESKMTVKMLHSGLEARITEEKKAVEKAQAAGTSKTGAVTTKTSSRPTGPIISSAAMPNIPQHKAVASDSYFAENTQAGTPAKPAIRAADNYSDEKKAEEPKSQANSMSYFN